MNLDTARKELNKAQTRLKQYQSNLRRASLEIERRNQSIVTLTTFTYQVTRTTNPVELIQFALSQALRSIHAPIGAVVLIDPDTKELMLSAAQGLNPALTQIFTGQEINAGAAALMPHLADGKGALLEMKTADDEAEKLLLNTGQVTSLVSLPLQLGHKLLGALLVGLEGERAFKSDELYFLMAMSRETVVALENLRLRDGLWNTVENLLGAENIDIDISAQVQPDPKQKAAASSEIVDMPPQIPQSGEDDLELLLAAMMDAETEVQQHNSDLQTLNSITEIMNSSLNLNQILENTINQTQAILKTNAVWLYLIDDQNKLSMKALTGLSPEYVGGMQQLEPGEGVEGRVLEQNKALFIESIADDTHKHKTWVDKEGLQALAAVPIARPAHTSDNRSQSAKAQVLGVLASGKKDTHAQPWNPREVRLLTAIANQLALALENANLYAQVQTVESELRTGNNTLRSINDMLLEKNAFLEGFMQDDLVPALTEASQHLQHVLAGNSSLAGKQKKLVLNLQEIVDQLNIAILETNETTTPQNNTFSQSLDPQQEEAYIAPQKPIRLAKKDDELKLPPAVTNKDTKPSPSTGATTNDVQPMSFEQAVAAGLVPAEILQREDDS